METIFLRLLNMSITAGWLVLAVLVLRLVLRRAPKWIHCLLWGLVGIRLLCPFSIESAFSLIPSAETIPVDTIAYEAPVIHSGVPVVDAVVNPVISFGLAPQPTFGIHPMQMLTAFATALWIAGVSGMLLYAAITTLRLYLRVRESVRLRDNVFQCDRIATPFILGVFRPRIYLPTALTEEETVSVLSHEKAHVYRRDHWWKPLGFLLLTIYWFHPLLWLGYILLCRDIEAACDQRVIRDMDISQRKTYSDVLLACSAPRHLVSACPLAFGETGVKSRIKSVLNYKKPTFWLVLVAVMATLVAAVCLLTNPTSTSPKKLDTFLTQVILEENKSSHTEDCYPTEAHTIFGTEKKDNKTIVYGMVLYVEFYLDENGTLQQENGIHSPTVITVGTKEDGSYYLDEYWMPGDGTNYPIDIRAKYPIWYWWLTDTQLHIDRHERKILADAEAHFDVKAPVTETPKNTTQTQVAEPDVNTFSGKVIQVADGMMLMTCYDTGKFTEVWVNYNKHPDLTPQVGDEYVITHSDYVLETYPPQVTAEVISPSVSSDEAKYITEKQAIEIASKYWQIKPGDRDPKTGYVMSIYAMETPTKDNPCYRMALRWLVETEGGTGNFSTLDTIYIHAETGEIALPGGNAE